MSDELIKLVKVSNKSKYIETVKDFDSQTIALKAEAAPKLLLKSLAYADAIKIQGNVIYKKTIENDGLRKQLGNVDETKLKEFTNWHDINDKDEEKNKIIYDELIKEINNTSNMLQQKK